MNAKVLFIDDEAPVREMFQRLFQESNYEIFLAKNGQEGISIFEKEKVHLVITDMNMPIVDGMGVLRSIKEKDPNVPVILITAYATIEAAVEAIKQGAYDYITKPFDPDAIEITLKNALAHKHLLDENILLKQKLEDVEKRQSMIGESPKMQEVFHLIDKVAPTDATVLIQGESGTGKELVARRLRDLSQRRNATYLSINCGALPDTLLESELFGYEKGAFTGAVTSKEGFFKAADKGTLFLDEIGEMPQTLQVKLLRVLQEKQILTVGGRKTFSVDVRIISATNKNLKEEVEKGHFRDDLFYRINIFTIQIPPLRERTEDIPLLLHHFIKRYNKEFSKNVEAVSPELMNFFLEYDWPGNIRELENYVERAILMAEGKQLEISGLPSDIVAAEPIHSGDVNRILTFKEAKEKFERDYVVTLLKKHNGVVARAARESMIPRPNFYEKLKKYGIVPKKK